MAYIPPHKRQAKGTENYTPPKPELLRPLFNPNNPNLKFKSSRNTNVNSHRTSKIIHANESNSRWFPVGFENDDDRIKFPDYVTLQPVSFDSIERRVDEKPLALIFNEEKESEGLRSPWEYVAENVVKDLLTSFERVRNQMGSNESEELLTPTLVAMFGKIIFRRFRGSSFDQESETEDLACDEDTLRGMRRSFNGSIPKSYMEYILSEGVQRIGVEFEEDEELYHVKLSDSSRRDSTISCYCRVSKDGKLELHKTDLNQARNMDNDMQSIRELIDDAVLDAGVKGGLRWSLGKLSSGSFSVVGVWHTTSKTFVNRSMRLKVREVDRFNFRTSSGETSREIAVKLKRIASELMEQSVDESDVKEMLKDDLRVLWDSFFCCESFVKW